MSKINHELEFEFASSESYIFTWADVGRSIEVHLHVGRYLVDHIYIIIRDQKFFINKDVKFLNYIDNIMNSLEMEMCKMFGFFKKELNHEIYIHVSFNSTNINFAPVVMFNKEYNDIRKNLKEVIFERINKLKPETLY